MKGTFMLHKLKVRLYTLTHRKSFVGAHTLVHTGYFSFVFLEGHGVYAIAGGAMAIFTVLLALAGEH